MLADEVRRLIQETMGCADVVCDVATISACVLKQESWQCPKQAQINSDNSTKGEK